MGDSVDGKTPEHTTQKQIPEQTPKNIMGRIILAAVVIAIARMVLGAHVDTLLATWTSSFEASFETKPVPEFATYTSPEPEGIKPLFDLTQFWKTTPKPTPNSIAFLGDQPAEASIPHGKPISFVRRKIGAVRLYQTRIDLQDPSVFLTVGLANNAPMANSRAHFYGKEKFPGLVKRSRGALTVNGTFFSGDARSRVMGNLIAEGRVLKYSRWENYGTTLGLTTDGAGQKRAKMVTARLEGRPDWDSHWFSLTAGPRLIRNGKIWLAPKSEGFRDRRVFSGKAKRNAIGISKNGRHLYLVTFVTPITLTHEAHLMHALGCREAMNLDGGSSLGLAHRGKVLINPPRSLTNVLVVYDRLSPAPQRLRDRWASFREGDRPALPGLH